VNRDTAFWILTVGGVLVTGVILVAALKGGR
jgi:hypothetical protein